MNKQYFIQFIDRQDNLLTVYLLEDKQKIRRLCNRIMTERHEDGSYRWRPVTYNLPFEATLEPRRISGGLVKRLAYALQNGHARDFMQWLIEEAYTEDIMLAVFKYEETREKLWEDKKPVTFTNLKNIILNK